MAPTSVLVTRSHQTLDKALDSFVANPDTFCRRAKALARRWDRDEARLEIRDPMEWRRPRRSPTSGRVASIEAQLRSEIEQIEIMDRESEARLARRIEFARIRLESALKRAGLEEGDVSSQVQYEPAIHPRAQEAPDGLPAEVCLRWIELHAMRRELVECNLYLALINVERYANGPAVRLDLIQEGSASLFRAVDGFEWRRGLLFRTYAVHWLNQAFRSYLYNNGRTVRVPVYLQKAMKHVYLAKERLSGRVNDAGALAAESGIKENVVLGALAADRGTISLDGGLGRDDEGRGASEWLCDERIGEVYSPSMEDTSLEDGLSEAMVHLSDRERRVLGLRFGLGEVREHTLSEVAGQMEVSLERIRQIQMRAIHKLRTPTLRRAAGPFL
ncbi:MAG TPA: sigma-70 family RNA polymerase sigma factor [Planctomycetes bacterium]|nr:sigma-70 family RNA polymerase sigma factor [Planctomycetota bacterium]HIK62145.1 sigma-70 family RNA polymerase sigma factor [Planctomycetota bacterium]